MRLVLLGYVGVMLVAGCSEPASAPGDGGPPAPPAPPSVIRFDAARDCPGHLLTGSGPPFSSRFPETEEAAINDAGLMQSHPD